MSPTLVGILGLAGLFLLIFLRVPIGIALSIAGALGYWALSGLDPTLALLGSVPFEIAYNYDLSIIALFVLMGNFAMASGMSRDLYAMARSLVGHWPGGLASATVVGCAGFAAVSGSSLASAVTMGRVALPEMRRHDYHPRLATGCVAAGGTLGILIPPSTGFIIYALLTEESIGQLFLAGVLPGLLLTGLFMAIDDRRHPDAAANPAIGACGPPRREVPSRLRFRVGRLRPRSRMCPSPGSRFRPWSARRLPAWSKTIPECQSVQRARREDGSANKAACIIGNRVHRSPTFKAALSSLTADGMQPRLAVRSAIADRNSVPSRRYAASAMGRFLPRSFARRSAQAFSQFGPVGSASPWRPGRARCADRHRPPW